MLQTIKINLHVSQNSIDGLSTYIAELENGKHVKIPHSAYHLLKAVENAPSLKQIADILTNQYQRPVSIQDVEQAYNHVVSQLEEIHAQPRKQITGLWFRRTFITAKHVNYISEYLTIFFRPLIAGLIMAFMIGTIFYDWSILNTPGFFSPILTDPLMLYILIIISVLFHEFGHAGAAKHYGVSPQEIGVGFYWIYTIFYTDVTSVYQLSRSKKIVVNFAGVYFQFFVAIVYLWIYTIFEFEVARTAFIVILFSSLLYLNPILKFDGYWVVSDTLGVDNLSQQPKRIAMHFWNKLRGKETNKLPWSNTIIWTLVIYTIGAFYFWAYFAWTILPTAWDVLLSYPSIIGGLIRDLSSPPYRLAVGRFSSLLMGTLILVMVVSVVKAAITLLFTWIKRIASQHEILLNEKV